MKHVITFQKMNKNEPLALHLSATGTGHGINVMNNISLEIHDKDMDMFKDRENYQLENCFFYVSVENLNKETNDIKWSNRIITNSTFSGIRSIWFSHCHLKDGCIVRFSEILDINESTIYDLRITGSTCDANITNTYAHSLKIEDAKKCYIYACRLDKFDAMFTTLRFHESTIERSCISESEVGYARDCHFNECRFLKSKTPSEGSTILRCTMNECFIVDTKFTHNCVNTATFTNTEILFSDFVHTHFTNVTFNGCRFKEVSFEKCKFDNVRVIDKSVGKGRGLKTPQQWASQMYIESCRGRLIINDRWVISFDGHDYDPENSISALEDFDVIEIPQPPSCDENEN